MRARWLAPLAVFLALPVALYALQGDSTVTVPPPDAHTQFVLGLGVLAAFIAQQVGSMLVSLWNKAGGWLDGKSNGLKQVVAVASIGSIGLLIGAIAQALTHATNWAVTFALSVAAGIVQVVSTGMTIDAVKSKLTSSERSSIAGR